MNGMASRIGTIAACDSQVSTVRPEATISDAAHEMAARGIGCVLVVNDQNRVVGILSERDIVTKVIGLDMAPDQTIIQDVMTCKVVACTPNTPISRAQEVMTEHGIRHMPIIDEGQPVGMISTRDILSHQLTVMQAFTHEQSNFIHHLEDENPGISQITTDKSGRVVI